MRHVAPALRQIPLGTGYAVWVGIGVLGTALAGVWYLGESISGARRVCLGKIVIDVVDLRLIESSTG